MRVAVLGGTGHVGKFMVPRLVEAGAEVVVVASGRTAVPQDKAWSKVKYLVCNTADASQLDNVHVLAPEVVIDMPGTAWNVYQKLKTVSKHIIACGSLWMYGLPKTVPTPEETQDECVFEGYEKRYAEILRLIDISRTDGIAFTAIMPPNICGPGKIPLECHGGRDIGVHKAHAVGKEVVLPDGADILIGPCDADDIAACFVAAVLHRDKAAGQIFNVGSDYALTASQFVQAYAQIYGVQIPIKVVAWQKYISDINPNIGNWWHFKAHMCPDISKAKNLLGYRPQYTAEQTLCRAVDWMKAQKMM